MWRVVVHMTDDYFTGLHKTKEQAEQARTKISERVAFSRYRSDVVPASDTAVECFRRFGYAPMDHA